MRITHYSFGTITIDGHTYASDVIIYLDRVDSKWRRKEGHLLQIEDLADIMTAKPSVLIIGTGASGLMKVPGKTLKYLNSNGVGVHIHDTKKAVELYNMIASQKPAIAALHLTC